MRENLYLLVRKADKDDNTTKLYDYFIIIVSFLSMIPLMYKQPSPVIDNIDIITVYILFADYILRWITFDFANGGGNAAFVAYPFTPFAIFDLISLLPSMGLLRPGFRILRILRIFKVVQYSDSFLLIGRVLKKERKLLLSVLYIALVYTFALALTIFVSEQQEFDTFLDAVYWSFTAFSSFGHENINPSSVIGKIVSIPSSIFGIAIISLPAGILTAAFLNEIANEKAVSTEAEEKKSMTAVLIEAADKLGDMAQTPEAKRYAIIMGASVLISAALKTMGDYFNLPLWLDTTGIVFSVLMLDITAGLIVGLVDNMYLAITDYGVSSLFYFSVSALAAVLTGTMLKKDGKINKKNIFPAILLIFAGSTILDSAIGIFTANDADAMLKSEVFQLDKHFPNLSYNALYCLSVFAIKIVDTIVGTAIVAALYFAATRKEGWFTKYMHLTGHTKQQKKEEGK